MDFDWIQIGNMQYCEQDFRQPQHRPQHQPQLQHQMQLQRESEPLQAAVHYSTKITAPIDDWATSLRKSEQPRNKIAVNTKAKHKEIINQEVNKCIEKGVLDIMRTLDRNPAEPENDAEGQIAIEYTVENKFTSTNKQKQRISTANKCNRRTSITKREHNLKLVPSKKQANFDVQILKSTTEQANNYNVEVCIGSTSFNCRSSVLKHFSEYFAKILSGNKAVAILPEDNVKPSIFATIYSWMLSTKPLTEHIDIFELLDAVNYLRITQLIDQCISRLEVLGNRVYLKACARPLHRNEEHLLKRICKAFYNLDALREISLFSFTDLENFLRQRSSGPELLKLMVIARWLNQNWSKRKAFVLELLNPLNFNRMPPWFLTTLTKNLHCEELQNIMMQKNLWLQINDAMYHKTEMFLSPPKSIKNANGSGVLSKFFDKRNNKYLQK